MISYNTDLVRRDSIEELCGHRARALQLYKQAMDTLDEAKKAHSRACAGRHIDTQFLRDLHYGRVDEKSAREAVDRGMWHYLIIGTPLGSLMDAKEKSDFEESLRKDPPEITPDTVFATMSRLAGDAERIFRRGLVEAFRTFCGDYHSHDGFKIGTRFIIQNLVTGSGRFRYLNHWREDKVRDLDRCMHVLDRKPAPEYQQGILAALRTAIQTGIPGVVTGDYFRVRWHAGGNCHFYPTRPDLVELANKMIADHYGEALGAGPGVRGA